MRRHTACEKSCEYNKKEKETGVEGGGHTHPVGQILRDFLIQVGTLVSECRQFLFLFRILGPSPCQPFHRLPAQHTPTLFVSIKGLPLPKKQGIVCFRA